MANELEGFTPDVATPPGATLKEVLDDLSMTQAELARRTGRPAKTINEIVKGKAAITPDTALDLERVLDIPATFWNNLERTYRETKARLRREIALDAEVRLARQFPYNEMAKRGWVPQARPGRQRVAALQQYFGCTSLTLVPKPAAVLRAGKRDKISPWALAAWLRKGEILAQGVHTAPFDRSCFLDALNGRLRTLTREPANDALGELRSTCAQCGVVVVFARHLPKTYAQGATRWLSPGRALIQLSFRYHYSDVFWFTFFHEAGHILKHGRRDVFIDLGDGNDSEQEREADEFAADTLIPSQTLAAFLAESGDVSAIEVRRFAADIGICPGIVVGRLQHERLIGRNRLNDLRTRVEWSQ